MTKLRLQNEFHDKDFRYELSPYDGCMAALGEAVNKLKEDPAFKLPGEDQVFMVGPDEVAAERRLSKEAQLLSNFVEACSAIFREHVWVKNRDEIDAEAFTAEYKGQVELFVSQLKKQETKNIAYSLLMAVCGTFVAILYTVSVAPLFYKANRDYVGSFFKMPKFSAETARKELLEDDAAQLTGIATGELVCVADLDAPNEAYDEEQRTFAIRV